MAHKRQEDAARAFISDLRKAERTFEEVNEVGKNVDNILETLLTSGAPPSQKHEGHVNVTFDENTRKAYVDSLREAADALRRHLAAVGKAQQSHRKLEAASSLALSQPSPAPPQAAAAAAAAASSSSSSAAAASAPAAPKQVAVPVAPGAAVPASASGGAAPNPTSDTGTGAPPLVPSSSSEPALDEESQRKQMAMKGVARKAGGGTGAGIPVNSYVGARDPRGGDFILAKVQAYLPPKKSYNVEDADPALQPEQRRVFSVAADDIIPLRHQGSNDVPALPVGSRCMAMYPDTTSFYPAIVTKAPRNTAREDEYGLRFDDDFEDDGSSPTRTCACFFVTAVPKQMEKQFALKP